MKGRALPTRPNQRYFGQLDFSFSGDWFFQTARLIITVPPINKREAATQFGSRSRIAILLNANDDPQIITREAKSERSRGVILLDVDIVNL